MCYAWRGPEHRVKLRGSPKPVGRRSPGASLGLSAIVVLGTVTSSFRAPLLSSGGEVRNLQTCSSLQVRLAPAWLSRCRPKPMMNCFIF